MSPLSHDGQCEHSEPAWRYGAQALPLATTDANRCTHKRCNGHRCALPVAHASEHYYREDGVPWRGEAS